MASQVMARGSLAWPDLVGLARSVVVYRLIPGRARRFARLYGPIVRPGDICFDIGAHVGNRSLAMARLGAKVIAAEPQPAFAAYLRWTIGRLNAVTVIEYAVGRDTGDTKLYVSRRTPTVSTTDRDWIESVGTSEGFARVSWDRHLTVRQTTLDAMIARYGVPRVCKIDVEGGDATVLAGLSQPIGHISFEYMPATKSVALACIDRLAVLGRYVYRATVGESVRFVEDRDWSAPEARSWIASLPNGARSGDLHARLIADDH